MRFILSLIVLAMGIQVWAQVPVQEDRNEATYNKQFSIGLNGYDPVSYFPEGGSVPIVGDPQISFTYGTIPYFFSSEQNKALFMENPLKYEPTYGGWCAYAMSEDSRIQINPLIFTLQNNRSHFFISKSAKRTFDEEMAVREPAADVNWKNFSGEQPRL